MYQLRNNQDQMLPVISCNIVYIIMSCVVPPVNYLGLKWQIDGPIELLLLRVGNVGIFPLQPPVLALIEDSFQFCDTRMDGGLLIS